MSTIKNSKHRKSKKINNCNCNWDFQKFLSAFDQNKKINKKRIFIKILLDSSKIVASLDYSTFLMYTRHTGHVPIKSYGIPYFKLDLAESRVKNTG